MNDLNSIIFALIIFYITAIGNYLLKSIHKQNKKVRQSLDSSRLKQSFSFFLSLEYKLVIVSIAIFTLTTMAFSANNKILDKEVLIILTIIFGIFYWKDQDYFNDYKSSLENFEKFYSEKYLNYLYRFAYLKKRLFSVIIKNISIHK